MSFALRSAMLCFTVLCSGVAVAQNSDPAPPKAALPIPVVDSQPPAPSFTIKPFKQPISILVEDSHGGSDIFNEYNFGSAQLGRILKAQGATVESAQHNNHFDPETGLTLEFLNRYRIVIFNGRYNGGGHTVPIRESEIAAITDWVRTGGGLLVTCPATTAGDHLDFLCFNPLIKPFGLQFGGRDLSDTYVSGIDEGNHSILRGLAGFYLMHGISVTGPAAAENVARLGDDSVMMALKIGKGRVVAFGGGSAIANQALNSEIIKHSPDRTVATNTTLLMNLALWLSEANPPL